EFAETHEFDVLRRVLVAVCAVELARRLREIGRVGHVKHLPVASRIWRASQRSYPTPPIRRPRGELCDGAPPPALRRRRSVCRGVQIRQLARATIAAPARRAGLAPVA